MKNILSHVILSGAKNLKRVTDHDGSPEILRSAQNDMPTCQSFLFMVCYTVATMHLQVYFTPANLRAVAPSPEDIYIVIDMIRATTTLPVMFERGAARVFVAGSVEEARAARERHPTRLLCGERNVQPLPGFDYGNSPAQFARVDLSGRELIMTTTNGTRAFYACPERSQPLRGRQPLWERGNNSLAGSFYNAQAVTGHAVTLARQRQSGIALVCSGELGYFALDDAVCAGYLAQQIIQHAQGDALQLNESVEAAITLYEAYQPPKIMDHCNSARSVINGGLIEDVYFCMQMNESATIPIVVGKEEDTGLWILEPYTP